MIGDDDSIDAEHGDVTEPTQSKSCYRVEDLANHMVDHAPGMDVIVVSTKDISCDKGHTQPQRDGCKSEVGE